MIELRARVSLMNSTVTLNQKCSKYEEYKIQY